MPKAKTHTITDRRDPDSAALACHDPAKLWDTFAQANRRNCQFASEVLTLDSEVLGNLCQLVMRVKGVAAWFDHLSDYDSSIEQPITLRILASDQSNLSTLDRLPAATCRRLRECFYSLAISPLIASPAG